MSVDVETEWDLSDVFGASGEAPSEIVAAPPSQALPASPAKPTADERLRAIEDEVLERHMAIVASAGLFPELDPALDAPPEEWVREFGAQEALKRFRVARSAWLPSSDVPAGLALSSRIVASMTKARALREASQAGGVTLNVQNAIFPVIQYERIEVTSGD